MTVDHHEDLINVLLDKRADLRMLALHLLCESYSSSSKILEQVFTAWDRWDAAQAFPEFPMLSFLAIPAERIEATCQRAAEMAAGRKLTEPACRCAGKLMEQLVRLPPRRLEPHRDLIEQTVSTSKIFFRVDLSELRYRIDLSDRSADQLAASLDEAIQKLATDRAEPETLGHGLAALEALRESHPNYIDLASVLAGPVDSDRRPLSASLHLTMQSLIQVPQARLELPLARHLLSEHEAVYTNVVEALVRLGSRQAGDALLAQLEVADGDAQKWIARGLQRIRAAGLSSGIAELRSRISDPRIWLMLLIAEVRQFDWDSIDRISQDLGRLMSTSETLIDSLIMFQAIHQGAPDARVFQDAVTEYVQRSDRDLSRQIPGNHS